MITSSHTNQAELTQLKHKDKLYKHIQRQNQQHSLCVSQSTTTHTARKKQCELSTAEHHMQVNLSGVSTSKCLHHYSRTALQVSHIQAPAPTRAGQLSRLPPNTEGRGREWSWSECLPHCATLPWNPKVGKLRSRFPDGCHRRWTSYLIQHITWESD